MSAPRCRCGASLERARLVTTITATDATWDEGRAGWQIDETIGLNPPPLASYLYCEECLMSYVAELLAPRFVRVDERDLLEARL